LEESEFEPDFEPSAKTKSFQTAESIIEKKNVINVSKSKSKTLPAPTTEEKQRVSTLLKRILTETLQFLEKERFIEQEKTLSDTTEVNYHPTKFGIVTSQMYMNVEDMVIFRDDLAYANALLKNKEIKLIPLTWLHTLTKTKGIPKLYLQRNENTTLTAFIEDHLDNFIMEEIWSPDAPQFPAFAQEVKMAAILQDWISEVPEKDMTEHFNIGQGDIRRIVDNAKWLMRALVKTNAVFNHENFVQMLNELALRIDKGVAAELVPLVKLRGIGRVRARKLYHEGFKTLDDIKIATIEQLANVPLIGKELAKRIKEQALNPDQARKTKTSGVAPKLLIKKKTSKPVNTLDTTIEPSKDSEEPKNEEPNETPGIPGTELITDDTSDESLLEAQKMNPIIDDSSIKTTKSTNSEEISSKKSTLESYFDGKKPKSRSPKK
jgi:replicative superfamily II helicase